MDDEWSGYLVGWLFFVIGAASWFAGCALSPLEAIGTGSQLLWGVSSSLLALLGIAVVAVAGEDLRAQKRARKRRKKRAQPKAATGSFNAVTPGPITVAGCNCPTCRMERRDGPAPDPPELPTEEATEPFVGYRAWDIHTDGEDYTLVSPVTGKRWPSPILRADGEPCPYDPHDPKWTGRDDHCHGIYAHDAPEWGDLDNRPIIRVRWGADEPSTWTRTGMKAMGRVELTGRVIVHERGYRAEVARITRLLLRPEAIGNDGVLSALADRYQCDLTFDPTTLEEPWTSESPSETSA